MIEHKRKNSPSRPYVILSGCMGTVVGLTYAMTGNTDVKGPFRVMAPYPVAMAELVTPASLIVTGELGDIVQQTTFAGYDDAGDIIPVMTITNQSLPGLGTPTPTRHPPLQIPLTDRRIINIDQVIRDCDNVVGIATVEIRTLREPPPTEYLATDEASESPFGQEGDYRLFFLGKNPDEETYGLEYGPCSRLTLDGSQVTCSDGDGTQLSFMEGVTVSDFVHAVETEVASQSCP